MILGAEVSDESNRCTIQGPTGRRPQEQREILPFVQQAFPDLGAWDALRVACVKPERTFWEKASLLHEQNTRPGVQPLAARQARHLYDLVRLWEHVENDAGLGQLFNGVRAHRKVFFNYAWVDYDALQPGGLQLLPPASSRDHWRADYAAMEPMFFEPPPSFSDLLARIAQINERLGTIK